MEPMGVRVCRETKQVSHKISCWFNFSAVVGNPLICISEGTAEPEGGHGSQDWKPGLGATIPGHLGCFSAVISKQRGAGQCLRSCCKHRSTGSSAHAAPHNPRAVVPKDPHGTGLGVGFGALIPSGNAAGLLVGYQLPQ